MKNLKIEILAIIIGMILMSIVIGFNNGVFFCVIFILGILISVISPFFKNSLQYRKFGFYFLLTIFFIWFVYALNSNKL
jgi:hypothetical protein